MPKLEGSMWILLLFTCPGAIIANVDAVSADIFVGDGSFVLDGVATSLPEPQVLWPPSLPSSSHRESSTSRDKVWKRVLHFTKVACIK